MTRLPDSIEGAAYCLYNCSTENINLTKCPVTGPNILKNNYQLNANFDCLAGNTRINYHCLPDTKIPQSALYFSSYYSFANTVIDITADNIQNYYLEFWFLIDQVNTPSSTTVNNYYLLAPPHFILRDKTDNIIKYANQYLSAGTLFYPMASIHKYEWNRIIIYNQYDILTNSYNIKIYVNYSFVTPEVSIPNLSKTLYDMRLQGIAFCNKFPASCQINTILYNQTWGIAWYRNIRIHDASVSSLYQIQLFEKLYSEKVQGMLLMYYFTADTIIFDTTIATAIVQNVKEYFVSPTKNFVVKWWWNNFDNAKRLNYSVDYDSIELTPGNFISQMATTTTYITSPCASSCKRCYSNAANDCYECNLGYALKGKQCYSTQNYYLKTPTSNSAITTVNLLDNFLLPTVFNVATQNPITISFWMKWMGVVKQVAIAPVQYNEIFYFLNTNSFFGYDNTNKYFLLRLNTVESYTFTEITSIIGVWTFVGISAYRSANTAIFPHMFNFQLQNQVLVPQPAFNPFTTPVNFDRLAFGTKCVSFFSDFRVYSTFYEAPYGHVTSASSTNVINMILNYKLIGSSSNNCIPDTQFLLPQTGASVSLLCVADYNIYNDSTNACGNDTKYLDVSLSGVPPCAGIIIFI